MNRFIQESVRICDKIGAGGHIPMKHLADSNGSRYIPREKLSKKARRQLDSQHRRTWSYPPVTKTFASKKEYNRKQKSCDYQNDWYRGIFCREIH